MTGGRNNEAWSAAGRPDSARRFTVPLLASIPENRVPGRRVVVKEVRRKWGKEIRLFCGGDGYGYVPLDLCFETFAGYARGGTRACKKSFIELFP